MKTTYTDDDRSANLDDIGNELCDVQSELQGIQAILNEIKNKISSTSWFEDLMVWAWRWLVLGALVGIAKHVAK